jgi:hypothetical protein
MTDFDYKKYSLENLEKWVEDPMSSANASPQEIYGTIHKVVSENYYHFKYHASRAYELMELLNGYKQQEKEPTKTYQEMIDEGWEMTADGFWYRDSEKSDKVVKWQLPVQQSNVDGVGDYYIEFPDDLLEAANLKEGDQVEWIDRKDGSFELRKVNGTK